MNIKIKINDKVIQKEVEANTQYYDILMPYQKEFDKDILLCNVNGLMVELNRPCYKECLIEPMFIDNNYVDKCYKNSAFFILRLALKRLYGKDADAKLCFRAGNSFIVEIKNYDFKNIDIKKLKDEINSIIDSKLKFTSVKMHTNDVIKKLLEDGNTNTANLLKYRFDPYTNIHFLDELYDYYSTHLLYDTSYVKNFDVDITFDNLVMIFPCSYFKEDIKQNDFSLSINTQIQSNIWSKNLECGYAAELNDMIAQEKISDLIFSMEAYQENYMGKIVSTVLNSKKKIMLIAGPSSSGKTTFTHRLATTFKAFGAKPEIVSVDNFYVDREKNPKNEKGEYDFECLEALDLEGLNNILLDLLAYKKVEIPHFNFVTGQREYREDFLQLNENSILLIEGIHCLNEKMSYKIDKKYKFKLFICALNHIAIDEHNIISTTDLRLLRRIIRDNRTRGFNAEQTIKMWPNVMKGEKDNIFPYQNEADMMFNTSLIYELAILKIFVEPLLFNVTADSPAYTESRRLLNFLSYFLATSPEVVPKNSIIREFIGGSSIDIS